MDKLIPVVGTMALLGSALVGGIFFAFSSFVIGWFVVSHGSSPVTTGNRKADIRTTEACWREPITLPFSQLVSSVKHATRAVKSESSHVPYDLIVRCTPHESPWHLSIIEG